MARFVFALCGAAWLAAVATAVALYALGDR